MDKAACFRENREGERKLSEAANNNNAPEKSKEGSAKMLIVLTVTAVCIGAVLAGFFQLVFPMIEHNRIEDEKRAIFSVLSTATDYEIIEREIISVKKGKETAKIFLGKDKEGKLVGYAFIAKGPGFQGIIKMMIGLNLNQVNLTGMKVIDQVETPGLGNKIVEDSFEGQFKGLLTKPRIEYIKNRKAEKPNQIEAITGATISSVAVARIINERLEQITKALRKKPPVLTQGGGEREEIPGSTPPEDSDNDNDKDNDKDKDDKKATEVRGEGQGSEKTGDQAAVTVPEEKKSKEQKGQNDG